MRDILGPDRNLGKMKQDMGTESQGVVLLGAVIRNRASNKGTFVQRPQ